MNDYVEITDSTGLKRYYLTPYQCSIAAGLAAWMAESNKAGSLLAAPPAAPAGYEYYLKTDAVQPIVVSWLPGLRYSYSNKLLYVEASGEEGIQLMFELATGGSLTGGNPDGAVLQNGVFYGYGANDTGDGYTRQWRFGKKNDGSGGIPGSPLKLTAKRASGETVVFSFTPSEGASRVQLAGSASTTPTNPTPPTGPIQPTQPPASADNFNYPLPAAQSNWDNYNNDQMYGVVVGPTIARESGSIRMELRKNWGAALQIYDKAAGNKPLINYRDHGRESELFIYSGPANYSRDMGGAWFNIGWNPGTTGNDGHPNSVGGKILSMGVVTDNQGREWIYTKTQMVSWPHVPVRFEEAYNEKWTRLDGQNVYVKFRLSLSRPDKTFYEVHQQEWPVAMFSGNLNTVHFYNGGAPFTGGQITSTNMIDRVATEPLRDGAGNIVYDTGQNVEYSQQPFVISEPWQAVRFGSTGRYVGFWTPTYYRTTNQINLVNSDNDDSEASNPCTYITSHVMKVLDSDGTYYGEYGYRVDGSLDGIRTWANSQYRETKPDYSFTQARGRNEWYPWKGTDQKEPFTSDNWKITFTGEDGKGLQSKLMSPVRSWKASDISAIYVRMKITPASSASPASMRLTWLLNGQQPDGVDSNRPNQEAVRSPRGVRGYGSQSMDFAVNKDGQFHTYAIPVSQHGNWKETIQQLELGYDLLKGNFPAGDQIEVSYVGVNNPGQ